MHKKYLSANLFLFIFRKIKHQAVNVIPFRLVFVTFQALKLATDKTFALQNQKSKIKNDIRLHKLPKEAYRLSTIALDLLTCTGIGGIIIDLDNTIISEDDRYISPGAEAWIRQAKSQGIRFFILSNGKRHYRVKFWSHRLGVPAINPAKKPFPFAFRKALKHMQLKPKQVVVIGDSRHTDMLGAWFVGCPFIQVATLPHPFCWWEKLLGKRVQMPYPTSHELWNNEYTYDK